MKRTKIALTILMFIANLGVMAQTTVSGYIENCVTSERLINASVYSVLTGRGTVTNAYGFFTFNLLAEDSILTVSYIGYKSKSIATKMLTKSTATVCLKENTTLSEVEVSAQRVMAREPHQESLQVKTIQLLPSLDGEADVMKAYQLTPGIASGTEGTTGILVRGGSNDQNLVLLDDVPLYFTSHFGGFVSVFNNNVISSSKVQKSGFGAEYGGRLSSVVDIRTRNGNIKKHKRGFHIGTLSSGFTLEGPIAKEKSSYLVSYRGSNVGMLMKAAWLGPIKDKGSIGFHDLNVKLNHKFTEKDRLYFTYYTGQDKIQLSSSESTEDYGSYYGTDEPVFESKLKTNSTSGNTALALRWNHVFGKKIFANTTAYYTNFGYWYETKVTTKEQNSNNEPIRLDNSLVSEISEFAVKQDLMWQPTNNLKFDIGLQVQTFHTLPKQTKSILEIDRENLGSMADDFEDVEPFDFDMSENPMRLSELNGYVGISYQKNFLKIYGGARYALTSFGNNIARTEQYLEPRLRINANATKQLSFFADYAHMHQPLHYMASNRSGLSSDVWLPATESLPSERSQQISATALYEHTGGYTASIAAFSKNMSGLTAYKTGTNLFTQGAFDIKTLGKGKGKVQGAEFMFKKQEGKLQFILSYTYTDNKREFKELNLGKVYPYKFAKKHDLSATFMYRFNQKYSLSAVWYYSSGTYVSLTTGIYPVLLFNEKVRMTAHGSEQFENPTLERAIFTSDVNNFQLPNYHRLDVNLNIAPKNKRSDWNIGLYNAYNKMNPFFIYYDYTYDYRRETRLKALTLFPILPSISYSYKL